MKLKNKYNELIKFQKCQDNKSVTITIVEGCDSSEYTLCEQQVRTVIEYLSPTIDQNLYDTLLSVL